MLRSVRSGVDLDATDKDAPHGHSIGRQLLIAVASPPRPRHSYALSGWPTWLTPTDRAGGHRAVVSFLAEER